MATAKSLAKPKILAVDGSVVRVQHPDISNYIRTTLGAQIAAGGTAMTVLDNNGFADNDWFVIGEVGHEKTEETDINDGSITRGTSLTITNTLKFAHEIDAPVTRILERGVKIYGAATDGGSGTLIASVDALAASGTQLADAVNIQWNKKYTEHNLITTDTTYAYYYATFTDGTTDSAASDYVASTGLTSKSAHAMIQNALDISGAKVNDAISWEFLIRSVQDWQDAVTQWVEPSTGIKKDWSFEFIEDVTSLAAVTGEDRYALSGLSSEMKYGETKQSILNIRFGKTRTNYVPIQIFDDLREGKTRSQVNGSTAAASTTLVVDDISSYSTSGSLYTQGQTLTYTGVTTATNTFTGIPASGTGSITATLADDRAVFQESFNGLPTRWTVYNGDLLFVIPPNSTYSGYPIKIRYIKKLTAITEVTDTTEIPFFNSAQFYIAYRIELKRSNFERAEMFKLKADQIINQNALSDKSFTTESTEYLNVGEPDFADRSYQDWSSDLSYF